jgi:hypothetical protein
MPQTLLARLIERQVTSSLAATIARMTDPVVEELALDLFKDPLFRVELQALVREAFVKALRDLQGGEAPPDDRPERWPEGR